MLKLPVILIALLSVYSVRVSAMDLFSAITSSIDEMLSDTTRGLGGIGGSSFGFTSNSGRGSTSVGGTSTSFSSSGGLGGGSSTSTSSQSGVTSDGVSYIIETTETTNGKTLYRTVTTIWPGNGSRSTRHETVNLSG